MLHVIGAVPAQPEVVRDAYIPLRVRWPTPIAGPTLYLRVDGTAPDGELEFKVHGVSGQLLGITVLSQPPAGGDPDQTAGSREVPGCPVVDLAPWSPNPDGIPGQSIRRLRLPLSSSGRTLRWGQPVVAWYVSGPVRLGVDSSQALSALEIVEG